LEFAHPGKASPAFTREPGALHVVSMGAVGPIMAPAVRALCTELGELRRQNPALAARLRFHFIGTSYAPAAEPSVAPIARECGVAELVRESPGRVPWQIAQETMRAADALVVLTSDDLGYTPSKLAGVFLSARPTLIVAVTGTAAVRLNDELGLGERLDPTGGTPGLLARWLQDLAGPTPRWREHRREEIFRASYTAAARTRELCVFFDQVHAAATAGSRP